MARGPVQDTGEAERAKAKRVGALRGLGPFLNPYRGLVALAGLALILTASLSLALPMAVRRSSCQNRTVHRPKPFARSRGP